MQKQAAERNTLRLWKWYADTIFAGRLPDRTRFDATAPEIGRYMRQHGFFEDPLAAINANILVMFRHADRVHIQSVRLVSK